MDIPHTKNTPDILPYNLLTGNQWVKHSPIGREKGFFFLLVVNGTAAITDRQQRYTLAQHTLLILTPSIRSTLSSTSTDFSAYCLHVQPDYFDSLPAGQLVYSHVSEVIESGQLPVFQLNALQSRHLQKTLELFATHPADLHLHRDGAIHHLCSFLLLQLADMLYAQHPGSSIYVKRSGEIFRNFKKLLVHHYREQHTIGFYADRLNISTTYLSRIVKNRTGRTVRFHIAELLCADARKLLESTDYNIKEIASLLGFSDQSVFGKFFLRQTGSSPLNFRTQPDKH